MVELFHADWKVAQIAQRLGVTQRTVRYHLNEDCRCAGPQYVYVPASWFKCRKCGGDYNVRNGCQHEWKMRV
jgi:predicted transcriptional regulator